MAACQLKQFDPPISSPEGYWRITSNGHPGTGSDGDSLICSTSALDRTIAASMDLAPRSSGYLPMRQRRERRGASSGDHAKAIDSQRRRRTGWGGAMSSLPQAGSCSAPPAIQRQFVHERETAGNDNMAQAEPYPSSNVVRSSRGDPDGIADWDIRLVPVPLDVHEAVLGGPHHECAQ